MNRTIILLPFPMRFNPGRKSRLQLFMAARILRLFPSVFSEGRVDGAT